MLDHDDLIAEDHDTHVFIVAVTGLQHHQGACPEGITQQPVLDLYAASDIDHKVRDLSGMV